MNTNTLRAVRAVQEGRAHYLAAVPFSFVAGLTFSGSGEPLGRNLDPRRVAALERYLLEGEPPRLLSPLTLAVNGGLEFVPDEDHRGSGSACLDLTAQIRIVDGRHRQAAIARAIGLRASLRHESIGVVILASAGLEWEQQLFLDLNLHARSPDRALRTQYDQRNAELALTRAAVARVPILRDLTEPIRLEPGSRRLFTFGRVHGATLRLIEGGVPREVHAIEDAWTDIACALPDWRRAWEGSVAAAALRRERVHAQPAGLEAIALACGGLISGGSDGRQKVEGLAQIDWSTARHDLWEGKALLEGRPCFSTHGVRRTADVILHCLQPEALANDAESDRMPQ